MDTGARVAMNTDLLLITQWLSPAYPVGAFSYSHGLETAVADGLEADGLEDWLADQLRFGAGRNDAILLSAAWRCEDVAELGAALLPTAERLLEAERQGAAFARVTRDVWGLELEDAVYPVVVGQAAGLKGIELEPILMVYLQAYVSNLVSAAIRLSVCGQTVGQAVLARLTPVIAEVAALDLGIEHLGSAVFASDIASARHEIQEVRLFQS